MHFTFDRTPLSVDSMREGEKKEGGMEGGQGSKGTGRSGEDKDEERVYQHRLT